MTNAGKITMAVVLGGAAVFALVALTDVDVSGDMELPQIETSGGEMPDVDVNTADIQVRERQGSVDVPTDIDVETERRTFTYPDVDIDSPEENTTAEEDNL